jgi:hypothetical protein
LACTTRDISNCELRALVKAFIIKAITIISTAIRRFRIITGICPAVAYTQANKTTNTIIVFKNKGFNV